VNENVDWAAVRREFPALANWTYLNTATLGLIPQRARAAVDAYFGRRDELAHTDFDLWWDEVDEIRGLIADFLCGPEAEDIAFFPNACSALSVASSAIDWKPGDEILTLTDEFPNQLYFSSVLPGVNLVEASIDDFKSAVTDRTRMIAVSTVSYQTGRRAPWEKWANAFRDRGIFIYVDATQSFGALTTCLHGVSVDMLAVDCYKWACAPPGAAFAYIHPDARARVKPTVIGWRSDRNWRDMQNLHHGAPEFSSAAEKYEGGMLPFPSLYGLKASLEFMSSLNGGNAAIENRVLSLARLLGGDASSSIVCLDLPSRDPVAVAARLREEKILVSARKGKLRISPHFYNNDEDIERLQRALRSAMG
jgi:cysteine desulfurase/selenocysteine lyase